jgi:hypothetical protein
MLPHFDGRFGGVVPFDLISMIVQYMRNTMVPKGLVSMVWRVAILAWYSFEIL